MGARRAKTKRKGARRVCRAPRLRADRRRKDPEAFVGVSPADVPIVPGASPPVFDPTFEGETFTKVELDESTGKPKMGRPRVPMSLDDARRLGTLNPTDAEVAMFFGVSERTAQRRKLIDPEFRRALEEGRAELKLSIRRAQLRVALEKEDWRALEWMGRQLLNQRKEPQGDGPAPVQGKSPLLDTLERMESALAAEEASPSGESGPIADDEHGADDPASEAVPEWKRAP